MKRERFDDPTCHQCGVRVYLGEDFCTIHEEGEGER